MFSELVGSFVPCLIPLYIFWKSPYINELLMSLQIDIEKIFYITDAHSLELIELVKWLDLWLHIRMSESDMAHL